MPVATRALALLLCFPDPTLHPRTAYASQNAGFVNEADEQLSARLTADFERDVLTVVRRAFWVS